MNIPGPTLGTQLSGAGNNFGVARLVAALVVVLGHCAPISGATEPAAMSLFLHNAWVGNYAVESFFVLSGLLVTRSFLSGRKSVARFAVARVLRLYPALICGVVISVVLAILCNANAAQVTLSDRHTWEYAWKNITAWEFISEINGAFPGNPLAGGPNGSLWTLPIEVRMYVWVGLLGALGTLARPRIGVPLIAVTMLFIVFSAWAPPRWLLGDWQVLFAAEFMAGMVAYLLRDHLRLSFGAALALVALYAGTAALADASSAAVVFACCLPYWLLVLTCHPAIPPLGLPGDYSYGVYVYAFPLQQTIAWLWPGIALGAMIAVSVTLILGVAALSWHVLEAPLLRLKPVP